MGKTFNIQRYSIHDGPGIRTTVFLQGCPLSCAWCHNPESQAADPGIRFEPGRCIACGACLEACPEHPAAPGPAPKACVRCGRCVAACPTGARQPGSREIGPDALVAEVLRDRPFFEESGGGVTFSGGEPLFDPDFLLACLRGLRAEGVHTAVDTTGFASRDVILEVARWTDLFLYDLKILDEDLHLRYTGVPLGPIVENLRALAAAGAAVWIRMPLIPGVNDSPESLERMGKLLSEIEGVRRVHLLPYHSLGADKALRLGRPAATTLFVPPASAVMDDATARLAGHGLEVHIGG